MDTYSQVNATRHYEIDSIFRWQSDAGTLDFGHLTSGKDKNNGIDFERDNDYDNYRSQSAVLETRAWTSGILVLPQHPDILPGDLFCIFVSFL